MKLMITTVLSLLMSISIYGKNLSSNGGGMIFLTPSGGYQAKNSPKVKQILLTDKNTVVMNSEFRASTVTAVQQKLAALSAKTKGDLYLVLDSPGGSVSAGLDLIDYAKSLPNKVHTITLFAASMAYITAQHLDQRYIVSSGRMMSHRVRVSGVAGQIPGEAISRIAHISKISRELSENVAKRVGVKYSHYMRSIYDELWLTANQAVESNHADAVVQVKCHKSLQGTYNTLVRTFFGEFNVEFSKCPLIKGPVSISTKNVMVRKVIEELFNHTNKKHFSVYL